MFPSTAPSAARSCKRTRRNGLRWWSRIRGLTRSGRRGGTKREEGMHEYPTLQPLWLNCCTLIDPLYYCLFRKLYAAASQQHLPYRPLGLIKISSPLALLSTAHTHSCCVILRLWTHGKKTWHQEKLRHSSICTQRNLCCGKSPIYYLRISLYSSIDLSLKLSAIMTNTYL